MPTVRPLRYFVLLAGLVIAGCSCDEDVLTSPTPGTCEPTFQCPPTFEYRLGDCRASRCQIDSECCPGQICTVGLCADKFVACTDDAKCAEVPGQKCIEFRSGRFCGYPNKGNKLSVYATQSCASDSDCDPGRSCFAKRCLSEAPCGGGCEPGSICDVDSNSCYPMPTCTQQCTAGQILVVADADTMSGPACCKLDCKCETLPPVAAGQPGWYSSLGVLMSEEIVSTYDPIYGDLVVARFDEQGQKKSLEYVDGFPTSGPITGNPAGPRGGRAERGSDVGLHTSLAVDAMNVVHVAYYDKDNGSLRYANNQGGVWKTSLVDDQGDVGYYTSLAIGADGNPRIAYMMVDGTVGPDPTKRAGLKLATARTNLPASESDWSVELIDSKVKPQPICGGGCPSGQACVDLGMGPSCHPTTVGCGMCQSGEACVMTRTSSVGCKERISAVPLDDLIEGTGLFASLALTSTGSAIIAYYDRLDGDLRLARQNGAMWILNTLDGDDRMNPTDVGQHVTVALDPMGKIALAYFDATSDDLVYMEFPGGRREIVDDGITPPNLRMVGADASLIFDAAGRAAIAYQDPTNIDLLYARRLGMPPMWSTEILRGDPVPGAMNMRGTASGFYVSQRRRGDTAYIASVDVGFTAAGDLLLDLKVLTKLLD